MSQNLSAKAYFKLFERKFLSAQDAVNAAAMKAYMRDRYEFYGIKAPLRRALMKEIIQENGLLTGQRLKDFVHLCWQAPQREWQLLGVDKIEKAQRFLDDSFLDLIIWCVQHRSWWDTVDLLAIKSAGKLLLKYPDLERSQPDSWIQSDNMWMQRTAILYQLKYKERTDVKRLQRYLLHVMDSKEFFLQKASGWALRELSKTQPQVVLSFIDEYEQQLSNLTKREAVKWMDRRNARP